MTDIEKVAREAGLCNAFGTKDFWASREMASVHTSSLERFAQAVARRCAEIAEATTEYGPMDMCGETPAYATAAAIRAEFGIKEEP